MEVSTVIMPYSTPLGFTEAKNVIPDLQVEISTLKQGFSQHLKDMLLLKIQMNLKEEWKARSLISRSFTEGPLAWITIN